MNRFTATNTATKTKLANYTHPNGNPGARADRDRGPDRTGDEQRAAGPAGGPRPNLLSSAVKFSPEQGGTIALRSYHEGDQVVDAVADQGVGFDLQCLAIVRRVAERLGGRAWAESELGKGSTFFLALPDPR